MEVVLIFLIILVGTALVLGWLVVATLAMIVRLFARMLASPFRAAKRADAAVYHRFAHSRPVRELRRDDVQCHNRACGARLPAAARFCARCGAAVQRQQAQLPPVLVEVPSRGFTQVA